MDENSALSLDPLPFWRSVDRGELNLFCGLLKHSKEEGWHRVSLSGDWDLQRMVDDLRGTLLHSDLYRGDVNQKERERMWTRLVFRPSQNSLIVYEDMGDLLSVWARTPEAAQAEFENLRKIYYIKSPTKRIPPKFYILVVKSDGVGRLPVDISRRFAAKEEDLALHYGDDFPDWLNLYKEKLKKGGSGATVLRGSPGTGKTSFIRHLIHSLKRTHRFYYLPIDCARMLSDPQMVEFWHRQNSTEFKKVVILEDAESLLMQRGQDNIGSIANMLNIADGLLGEFLQLHLIYTINCEIDKLDPAIVRSGRLVEYKHFRRLSPVEAGNLALKRGLQLPNQPDYSLAEIYSGGVKMISDTPKIGF